MAAAAAAALNSCDQVHWLHIGHAYIRAGTLKRRASRIDHVSDVQPSACEQCLDDSVSADSAANKKVGSTNRGMSVCCFEQECVAFMNG